MSFWGGGAILGNHGRRIIPKNGKPRTNTSHLIPAQWARRPQQSWTPALSRDPAALLRRLGRTGAPIIEGNTVHFVYHNPHAREAAITGELNDWGRTGVTLPMSPLGRTGIFYRNVELDGPARIEYQLAVDGRVIPDPPNPNRVDSGIGGLNSCFVVGDFRDPPEIGQLAGRRAGPGRAVRT